MHEIYHTAPFYKMLQYFPARNDLSRKKVTYHCQDDISTVPGCLGRLQPQPCHARGGSTGRVYPDRVGRVQPHLPHRQHGTRHGRQTTPASPHPLPQVQGPKVRQHQCLCLLTRSPLSYKTCHFSMTRFFNNCLDFICSINQQKAIIETSLASDLLICCDSLRTVIPLYLLLCKEYSFF